MFTSGYVNTETILHLFNITATSPVGMVLFVIWQSLNLTMPIEDGLICAKPRVLFKKLILVAIPEVGKVAKILLLNRVIRPFNSVLLVLITRQKLNFSFLGLGCKNFTTDCLFHHGFRF